MEATENVIVVVLTPDNMPEVYLPQTLLGTRVVLVDYIDKDEDTRDESNGNAYLPEYGQVTITDYAGRMVSGEVYEVRPMGAISWINNGVMAQVREALASSGYADGQR